jgi:hypothetical protein
VCSKLLNQRKNVELQWLQNTSQINVNNLTMKEVKPVELPGTKKENI